MAIELSDAMTGTGLLSAHSPETGGTWTIASWDADTASLLGSGYVSGDVSSSAYYYNTTTFSSAEYDITLVARTNDVNVFSFGCLGRYSDGSSGSGYGFNLDDTQTLRLYKRVSGTETALASWAFTGLAANTDYTFLFQIRNGSQKVFVNSTERLSATDTAITSAGQCCLRMTSSGLINSVSVDTVGGGAGLPLPQRSVTTYNSTLFEANLFKASDRPLWLFGSAPPPPPPTPFLYVETRPIFF